VKFLRNLVEFFLRRLLAISDTKFQPEELYTQWALFRVKIYIERLSSVLGTDHWKMT
jgi:hypothetical protein